MRREGKVSGSRSPTVMSMKSAPISFSATDHHRYGNDAKQRKAHGAYDKSTDDCLFSSVGYSAPLGLIYTDSSRGALHRT